MILSILIPTLPDRGRSCARLVRMLSEQALGKPVGILTDETVGATTGWKRNRLLDRAQGAYVCFIDDDDLVADDYVDRVLSGCAQGADCCTLDGVMITDKRPPRAFRHRLEYATWRETPQGFERSPNHLNAVRRDLACRARFPDLTIAEDHAYSRALQPLLKTQAEVPGCLYWYFASKEAKARAASLRFLLKWPTKGRPEMFKETLRQVLRTLSGKHPVELVVSVDSDDTSAWKIQGTVPDSISSRVVVGPAGRGKIGAINADIPATPWDVLVLLADDMIPVEHNWDDRIVADMARNFPTLDGLLVYDDGFAKPPVDSEEVTIATMPVMGRRFYDRHGYIYHSAYTSLWCDNELAEVAKRAGKAKRIPRVIIRHDWVGQRPDDLLRHNESFYSADKAVYEQRKAEGFPRGTSTMYSQNNEEEAILATLGTTQVGRFLDIGAYDGKTLSNTRRLAELGWYGVLVEPAPGPFRAALELYRGNTQVQLFNVAVAGKAGFATFRDSRGDAVSTLSEAHADLWSSAGIQWDPYMVHTVTPRDLFAQVGWEFDFVTLDVEGMNLEVFKAIPWDMLARHGLRLICIEHENNEEEMGRHLEPLGFERFYLNAENAIFRKRSGLG